MQQFFYMYIQLVVALKDFLHLMLLLIIRLYDFAASFLICCFILSLTDIHLFNLVGLLVALLVTTVNHGNQ